MQGAGPGADAIFAQQSRAGARVLAQDQVAGLQRLDRAAAHVAKVAYWCGNKHNFSTLMHNRNGFIGVPGMTGGGFSAMNIITVYIRRMFRGMLRF
ncbi:hypothetical protein AA15237_0170 [Komagataeibacter xylinus NBRC 15237]|nr:hypothetical protein AA15237_0170 [Komagataeibacter xylinus NBRC 15237]